MSVDKEKLVSAALAARKNAYAPYSGYGVGAAVLTASGEIFTGVNVENASFGMTICAERAAIISAVSQGHVKFAALAVAVGGDDPAAPCGACRQVMEEFFDQETKIFLVNSRGEGKERTVEQLLPEAFSKANM